MAHLCLESCFESVSHIEGDKLMMDMVFFSLKKLAPAARLLCGFGFVKLCRRGF